MATTDEYALDYYRQGWVPLWIMASTKAPKSAGWQTTAYTSEAAVSEAFKTDGNIGILLGTPSGGLIDIDLDSSMAIKLAGSFLPHTGAIFGRASAPSSHWLYKVSGPVGKPIRVVDLWSHLADDKTVDKPCVLELRTNGQTVFPPSTHPSGEAIEWVTADDPADVAWDVLFSRFGKLAAAVLLARAWGKLSRHAATMPLAGVLLRGGFTEAEAIEFVLAVATAAGDTEVADRLRVVKDTARKFGDGDPVSGLPTLRAAIGGDLANDIVDRLGLSRASIEDFANMAKRTDVGNADRFLQAYGRKFHFSGATGWLHYDGQRWMRDPDGASVGHAAQNTVRAIWAEASKQGTSDERDEMFKWAKSSEGIGHVKAIPELAKSDPRIAVDAEKLDSQDLWLNCSNGTLNLVTGELMPHNQEHLITRMANVNYDAEAKCPRFIEFLNTSMKGDVEMVSFLLRSLSLGLAGQPARNLFIWWGVTNSGKSTLLSIIENVLGDYAASAQSDTLMADKGGVRSDLARLNGCRFVRISEIEDGKRMAEAMVKQITGNDAMTAAFKFKDDFQFKPKFKVTMATNYKPVVKADDEALWERVILIPWEHTVDRGSRVPDLDQQLFDAEGPGILALLVKAFRDVMKNGLNPPDKVKAATATYREELDNFGDWLNEETEEDEKVAEPLAKVHAQYMVWCREAKLQAMSRPAFTRRLTAKGVKHGTAMVSGVNVRCMLGRKLKEVQRFGNIGSTQGDWWTDKG